MDTFVNASFCMDVALIDHNGDHHQNYPRHFEKEMKKVWKENIYR
jgi:hypothetical protein